MVLFELFRKLLSFPDDILIKFISLFMGFCSSFINISSDVS